MPIESLKPYERNARIHPEHQIEKLCASMIEFGFNSPILVSSDQGIIAGHGRLMAAKKLGLLEVPVVILDHLSDAQRRAYILADNRIGMDAGWDREILQQEIEALGDLDFDLSLAGFSNEELERLDDMLPPVDHHPLQASAPSASQGDPPPAGQTSQGQGPVADPVERKKLSDQFLVPPFSVLDARQGYWQERKRAWLALGIKSEVGRGDNLIGRSLHTMAALHLRKPYAEVKALIDSGQITWTTLGMDEPDPEKREAKVGTKNMAFSGGTLRKGPPPNIVNGNPGEKASAINMRFADEGVVTQTGTSIFDPVLCELSYRWFSPKGGVILDPFAGGSVRGIVASKLGRRYYGCDLRQEQVAANLDQWDQLIDSECAPPTWHCGDSRRIDEHFTGLQADMIFSCPPYADLEVYSDDPADLSTLDYEEFRAAYAEIIRKSVSMLKQDRFAVFVVGEVREKKGGGFYRNFVKDTIEAFEEAGARFYNEMILLTSAGTLALRAGRVFSASRKIGKTHQNVLVFCKGDPFKATEACGEVDISLPEGMDIHTDDTREEDQERISTETLPTSYGERVTSIGGDLT